MERRRATVVAIVLALVFAALAVVVETGHTGLDGDIAVWIAAQRSTAGTDFFLACAELGTVIVIGPISALAAGYLILRRRARDAAWLVVAAYGASALYWLAKVVFERPRPGSELRVLLEPGYSFPSGHAAQASAFWLTAAILVGLDRAPRTRRLLVALAIPLVLLPAASRIYLDVHWTTDVLAGLCLGTATCFAVLALRRDRRAS